ncbi:MAG TPA: alpha/beta hydrolase [Pseudonocardiaceae bacterium]|nr:alpha/beta hydrolase [Pseudonocardiaceae bacterium]
MVGLLAGLRTPALLITGAPDLVTGPRQRAGFHSTVRSGTVETFPDSGHFVALEEPARYADLVTGFTTQHLHACRGRGGAAAFRLCMKAWRPA